MLSVYPRLEILIRRGSNALFRPGQEIHPLAEDYRPRGAHRGAGRLPVLLQALVEAELALDDLRIPPVPLEFWHVEWAGHLAEAAADAARRVPRNRTPLVLLQGPERAARHAGGIEAVHALLFDVGEACPTRFLVEFDDILGLGVKIRRHVPQAPGERCVGRQPIGLAAGRHAGFAAGADRVVVEH